jgi:putative spermidine/putrescine transport system permease protein
MPSAFIIERKTPSLRALFETIITSPRTIPQIVLVVGFLIYFERIGIYESLTGLVIAHLIISIPFAYRTISVSVSSLDPRLEQSSAILGADPMTTFLRITLPLMKTGVIAAFIFTFILSFNNVTIALFLAKVGEPTLPVEMFQRMYVGGMTPVIPAIAFSLAVVGAVLFIALDRTIGVFKYLGGGK